MSRQIARTVAWTILLLAAASRLPAPVTVYTWTGLAGYGSLYDSSNWLNAAPPANVSPIDTPAVADALANTQLVFGNSGNTYAYYYTLYANRLTITGNVMGYQLQGDYETTHIGSGGITYTPANPVTTSLDGSIQLEASQTWDVQSGALVIGGSINDSTNDYSITKTGSGSLFLANNSPNWSGGLVLSGGRLVAFSAFDSFLFEPVVSPSLGTGALTFNGGTLVAAARPGSGFYDYQALVLNNAIVSNGLISVTGYVPTSFETSTVTLNQDTTIKATAQPLYIHSNIVEAGGARKLTIDSATPVFVMGGSSWTGGTDVINRGIVVFDGTNNVPGPAGSITVAAEGYAGTGENNSVATFLAAFSKPNTLGTVGFDSEGGADTFTSAIDLTGFNASARLGSATSAILSSTATITPQGSSYRFGGGGGWLQVDSLLTGTNSLVLDSPASRPLMLYVTNLSNNYTGGTSVTHSGVVFKQDAFDGAFSGAAGSVSINQGGYVGFEAWGDQSELQMVNGSLARINPTSIGMVGFESTNIAAAINLGAFTNGLYLGTASPVGYDGDYYGGMDINGVITTGNAGADPYRFAGYKSGRLVVNSTLTGNAGVVIGDPNSPGTFGDPTNQEYASVSLAGNNATLTGNVTFYGGRLEVEQANGVIGTDPTNALGTGALLVQPMTLPDEWKDAAGAWPLPELVARGDGMIIANNITLNRSLRLGGFHGYTLTGTITGTGGLRIEPEDYFNEYVFRLSGNNTFSGGIHLESMYDSYSALELAHNNAAGTGPITFGGGETNYYTEVYLQTAAPVIGGLSVLDYETADALVVFYAMQPNTVLTINQAGDSVFGGDFYSEAAGDAMRVVKNGSGSLAVGWGGLYFTNGTPEASLPGTPQVSLQINQGTVVIGNDFFIGNSSPTIWVHGGTLALANLEGYGINNPIVVDNGGRITGNGFLSTSVSIGTGATLSPGAAFAGENPIGRLDFWHLDAKAGGTLEWDIMSTDADSAQWDQIWISTPSTLDFSTINLLDAPSASTRFTLKVISRTLAGTQGLLADFDPALNYSWLLFSTDGIAGYDPAKVIIDSSLFTNSLDAGAGNGYFFLSQTGNNLFLNFAPVPEPSTYALMIAGLAAAALQLRRRKRLL